MMTVRYYNLIYQFVKTNPVFITITLCHNLWSRYLAIPYLLLKLFCYHYDINWFLRKETFVTFQHLISDIQGLVLQVLNFHLNLWYACYKFCFHSSPVFMVNEMTIWFIDWWLMLLLSWFLSAWIVLWHFNSKLLFQVFLFFDLTNWWPELGFASNWLTTQWHWEHHL